MKTSSDNSHFKFGIQIGSDVPQMGQIWDFLRSVSVHFGAGAPKCTETDLKKYQICSNLGANLTQFVSNPNTAGKTHSVHKASVVGWCTAGLRVIIYFDIRDKLAK